jgi:serine/threonine-protein kinase
LEDALQQALGPDYAIEGELGGGGMSRVFVAHDKSLDRKVVVKVMAPETAGPLSAERFKLEIMVSAGLQHPNIIGVISAGEAGGVPFFVMPFVEGESLRALLKREPQLPARQAASILRDVARALAFAHERGVIHRDIKPDNVLLTAGAATLADFGVAKAVDEAKRPEADADPLTSVGTSLGTPAYMAPEQIAGDADIDHRADLYAFGAMAYEMLAGRPPFADRAARQMLAAHLTETPAPLGDFAKDLPSSLVALVERCLEKDPKDRPVTAADVAASLEEAVVSTEPISVTGLPISQWRRRNRTAVLGAAGVAAVLVIAALVRVLAGGGGPPPGSVAVLPFVNVGGDTTDLYFTDGMSDEIIGALSRVAGLRVASRTASFAFRNANLPAGEIGGTLNVSAILEGTVRRRGDRLRVTAQLVSTDDGLTLWSETYDRDMQELFAVQDELATAIAAALGSTIGVAAPQATASERTTDLAAYDLYLQGRFQFERRGEDALLRSLDYYREAVDRDDGFAAAHAGIADVYATLPLYSSLPGDSLRPLALAAVDRALALDSNLAGAYAARGTVRSSAWEWELAVQDFERAIELDPNDISTRQWYGENLMLTGNMSGAIEQFAVAVELDPFAAIPRALMALSLGITGDADQARQEMTRAIEADDTFFVPRLFNGTLFLYEGDPANAIRELMVAERAAPVPGVLGTLGYAYAISGETDAAHAVLARIDTSATSAPAAIARIHLGLGDLDAALMWMDRAVDVHDPFYGSEPLSAPIFDRLRAAPGFADIARRVHLDPARLDGGGRTP